MLLKSNYFVYKMIEVRRMPHCFYHIQSFVTPVDKKSFNVSLTRGFTIDSKTAPVGLLCIIIMYGIFERRYLKLQPLCQQFQGTLMYTIHAYWKLADTDNLYLWAESHTAYKKHAPASQESHPFAAQHIELVELLQNCAPSIPFSEGELLLELPTAGRFPLASFDPSLKAEEFRRWSLPALRIPPREALELLTADISITILFRSLLDLLSASCYFCS